MARSRLFVGHGDEFNNEWVWKQELVVPPGKYELTVIHGDPQVWSTPVDVEAGKRVIVDAFKGVRKTVSCNCGGVQRHCPDSPPVRRAPE